MESTHSSSKEKIPNKLTINTRIKTKYTTKIRALSPFPDLKNSPFPPLLFNLKSQKYLNITPPPRVSPVKLEPISNSSSRIHSIIKKSLFPEKLIKLQKLPRAPSMNDIQPIFMNSLALKMIPCRQCKKPSVIHEETHLLEYKTWGLCSNCQNQIFSTIKNNEISEVLTFKNIGDFCEFSMDAEIGFWLEGKLWNSVSVYLKEYNGKLNIYKANLQKVKQHPRLEELLARTGDKELIYFLPDDLDWGVGFNGIGNNRLGKILMDIRSEVKVTGSFNY